MRRTKAPSFYVIANDFNMHRNYAYDVIPYFVSCYKSTKPEQRPKTIDALREFIKGESLYMFWGRCEWEIIISDWPNSGKCEEKWDVHQQIMMNFDIVVKLLAEYFGIEQ